jgi:hypothetical protein
VPVEVGIWRIGARLEPVQFSSIETELILEDAICSDLEVIEPGLLLIARQVSTAHGKFIDLLACDAEGNLVIVELKRNRTPREVVAQVIDYATWVNDLTHSEVTALFRERNAGKHFEEAFTERYGVDPPERLNESHRMIVVASELDSSTERLIGYLSAKYGVPINAVFFRHYKEDGKGYLVRSWLIDPNEAEAQASKSAGTKASKEPWNGTDFYVSVGEGAHRSWDDMRRYGFVSAGGGRWYTATLRQLSTGARVFACIPQIGYVGTGRVVEAAVPVTHFEVSIDGNRVPLLRAPLKAPRMEEHTANEEVMEYAVRVQWDKAVPQEDAVWEKGMFANQNTVCKLRSSFTLERLYSRFGISE